MVLTDCPPHRRMSAALFGNRHKLELLIALADAGDEGVSLSQLSAVQGVPASVYYGPIRDLINVGLVDRLGRAPGERRRWYRRREGRFWDSIGCLAREVAEIEVEVS